MMVTETNWPHPLGYQSEAPFLTAAYQSLNGVDAVVWVSAEELEWSNHDRAGWDADSQVKWIIATPMLLGQFPAAALMYRRGDVAVGQPVVVEHRSDKELWERTPPIIAEDRSMTPIATSATGPNNRISPLPSTRWPFSLGRVEIVYGSDREKTTVADPSRFIDRDTKSGPQQYRPNRLGLRPGILHDRRAQGTGRDRLPQTGRTDQAERRHNPVGKRLRDGLVVALDDKPLAQSGQVLVQVGTRHRPTGWADHAATFQNQAKETIRGRQVDSTGKMPWVVQVTMVTIEVQNSTLKSATLLDLNGNARSKLPVRNSRA